MDEYIDGEPGAWAPGTKRGLIATVGLLAALVLGLVVASRFLVGRPDRGAAGPDPFLAEGRRLYDWRCASCHGKTGIGNGPIAGSLKESPGDLTDDRWTHGDRPDQVLAVVAEGVPDTSMAGWRTAFDEDELRAVTAYVYVLAGREVPVEYRR